MASADAPPQPGKCPEDAVVVGKITTVHGVRGWVKIHAFTESEESIFRYQPWWVAMPEGWQALTVDHHRPVAKGFIAHIVGVDDRELARRYCQRQIRVSASLFPPAGEGEYYWHQLEGLRVIARHGGRQYALGRVDGFLETGANDVMVVEGDDRQRLVPYIDDVIAGVDLERGEIQVYWDPEF